jgi:hypothetical protein
MSDVKIKAWAHFEPTIMFEAGKNAGMSDKAADYFRYFEEIDVTITADKDTGEVKGVTINE